MVNSTNDTGESSGMPALFICTSIFDKTNIYIPIGTDIFAFIILHII